MTLLNDMLLTIAVAGLLAASFTDLRERLIYNEIVLFVFAVGIVLRLTSTPSLLWVSLAVSALLLVLLGLLARFEIMGGGDVKLIAASTLIVAPQHVPQMIANIVIAGGVLSCIYLVARKILPAPITRPCNTPGSGLRQEECARIRCGEPMPYALAILGGVTYSIVTEAIP